MIEITQKTDYNITEVMASMLKSYATYENYDKLVFTMTPDLYAKYQDANFVMSIDAGIKPKLSKYFRGVRIKQKVGEHYLTLSCE